MFIVDVHDFVVPDKRITRSILLLVKLAVRFCWLLPLPTSYLSEVQRKHSVSAYE